jgi:glyoxylase-like metal-dependent hydrolase (beta-lactamase superfamily II)
MALQIIPFQSSMNTCYIIKDRGSILIDAGSFNNVGNFSKVLLKHKMKPEEIKLIVLTHGDFDHVGGTKELKSLSGAKVAIHEEDRKNLEEGIFHWPKGVTPWGRITIAMFKPILKNKMAFPLVKADLILGNYDQSLEEFGIDGRIIHTPGHTPGSVSVLLDTGEAFIGCLIHNKAPFVLRPRLPIYAQDILLLKKSLRMVVNRGAKTLYPGHGKPVPVQKILKYLN